MLETQRELFGDALVAGGGGFVVLGLQAAFLHSEVAFYNFPYTFGYLLSRALFAEFKQQGAAFLPRYEEFLRNSGRAKAHEVARATLGKDPESPEFWREAIDTLRGPLAQLEEILPRVLPG